MHDFVRGWIWLELGFISRVFLVTRCVLCCSYISSLLSLITHFRFLSLSPAFFIPVFYYVHLPVSIKSVITAPLQLCFVVCPSTYLTIRRNIPGPSLVTCRVIFRTRSFGTQLQTAMLIADQTQQSWRTFHSKKHRLGCRQIRHKLGYVSGAR